LQRWSFKNWSKKNCFSVLYEEWELFIFQERLQDIMDVVNRSSVSRSEYFFIHNGKKEKLSHCPIDQFNGNRLWLKKNIFITARQKKFHQKVSDMLLSLY